MDEREALGRVAELVPSAGDDAAVIEDLVLSTDMLHERADFPPGTTRYTAGWRAVGASLSDLAAMGAEALGAVAAYGSPTFESGDLDAFIAGATDVCETVDTSYVGGDLDAHSEFTVATTALGRTDAPVSRSGASPGEAVCVTGTLGRSAAAVRLFQAGETERANDLFRFTPRIEAGRTLARAATAMLDSSDGLARSLHQLGAASDCGFSIESPLPLDGVLDDVADGPTDRRDLGLFFGEDFELVCTMPASKLAALRESLSVSLTRIGTVTAGEIRLDGELLPDRGYTHGD